MHNRGRGDEREVEAANSITCPYLSKQSYLARQTPNIMRVGSLEEEVNVVVLSRDVPIRH